MAMDFQRGYQTAMADPRWKGKSFIASLYSLIPVVGPFVLMGMLVERVSLVAGGNETELPPRPGRFGEYLATGFTVMLPALAMVAIILVTAGLGFLLYIPFVILYPALISNYLTGSRTLGELFHFGEAWARIKAHSESYLNYWLASFLYSLVASVVMVPLVFMAEVPMFVTMGLVNGNENPSMGILIGGLVLTMAFMLAVFVVLYAASAFMTWASYYYLGTFAREAFPERLGMPASPQGPAGFPPAPPASPAYVPPAPPQA